ncbi:hypothetical protein B484DRAFT_251686 [Ochromonadaceae sp. CCMP2298]|nr:hypothetical protein B484DRAFT_251686 [Ochromonadaceae sp. CCMP2298]
MDLSEVKDPQIFSITDLCVLLALLAAQTQTESSSNERHSPCALGAFLHPLRGPCTKQLAHHRHLLSTFDIQFGQLQRRLPVHRCLVREVPRGTATFITSQDLSWGSP